MIHIEFANIPYISYIFTLTEIRIRGKTKIEKEQKVSLHNVQTRQEKNLIFLEQGVMLKIEISHFSIIYTLSTIS